MATHRFLLLVTISILLAETIVFMFLSRYRPLAIIEELLFSVSVVTLIISPIFYYLFLKPTGEVTAERNEALKKMQSSSITDSLTGLYNRNGFHTMVKQHLKLSKRLKKKSFLLNARMVNGITPGYIPNPKKKDNDVIAVANILRTTYRKSDVIARMGEQSFAVCPAVSPDKETNITVCLERLHSSIDTYNGENGKNSKLSLNIGISPIDHHSTTFFDDTLS